MTGYVLTLVSTHEGLDEASYQNIMGKSGGGVQGTQTGVNKLPKHHCRLGLFVALF